MPAQRYTKRPDTVEAIPAHEALDAAAHDWDALPEWLRDAYDDAKIIFAVDEVRITHPSGRLTATGTDMLIHMGGYTITVQPADQFAAAYAPLEQEGGTP